LLAAITMALSAAGANVHAATITTTDGKALDTFELSDSRGRKLGPAGKSRLVSALITGVNGRVVRPRRFSPR
ncbi:MAG TPA: hypothetical protein VF942_16110, partial [Acidimicrobiales bacterium]